MKQKLLRKNNGDIRISKAWLARWCPFGNHAIPLIKKMSPQGQIVDVLNSRKNFDYIFEYAKNIYKLSVLSLSEKLPFAHYTKGEKYSKDFFSRVPIFTHYQSGWYREMCKELENNNSEAVRRKWREKSAKYPQYVIVGHNPYLDIREVFNLTRWKDKNGRVVLAWDELVDGGTIQNVVYRKFKF